MPKIELTTEIFSKIELCFDLSRSIDLHEISTEQTKEKAVEGTTSGLINLNEHVTLQATHFFINQKLTSKVTVFERPTYFKDEQQKGPFKTFYHEHKFEQIGDKVVMKDVFEFQSPFGIIGIIFNKIILTRYLKNLLKKRNNIIKEFAESEKWRKILK